MIIVEREGKEVAATTDDKSAAAAKESKEQPAENFSSRRNPPLRLTTGSAWKRIRWASRDEQNSKSTPISGWSSNTWNRKPGRQGGVKANDVLLKAGDKPLRQTADLAAAIQESKGNDLKLEIEHRREITKDCRPAAIARALKARGKKLSPGLRIRLAEPADGRRTGDHRGRIAATAGWSQSALLKARQMELSGRPGDGPPATKALWQERRAMQQQLQALNEKLAALGADAENGSADKIRGQMTKWNSGSRP